jgi:hypothetical protein
MSGPSKTFATPAGVLAFAVPLEPASDATAALNDLQTLVSRAYETGAPKNNRDYSFEKQRSIREQQAASAEQAIDRIEQRVNTFADALAARRQKLSSPPAPSDAAEAARHAEIRTWFIPLDDTRRAAVIREATTASDAELLSALWFAPAAFKLLKPEIRATVGEALARASNDAAYEALLVNEEQLKAAREAIARARVQVHAVIAWEPSQYDRAAEDFAFRSRLVVSGSVPSENVA